MLKFTIYIFLIILSISCTKEIAIFDADANEDFELPLILRLDGFDCFLDSKTNTFTYSIDSLYATSFSPFVKFQKYSSITFNNQSLLNEKVNNLGSVELNKNYSLIITTAGKKNEFNLVFKAIPTVRIVTLDKIIRGPKILAKMDIKYPNKAKLGVNTYVGIEVRGKTSATFDKKSYGLNILASDNINELANKSFFDLKANNKWILDAMYVDKAKGRNKVSFDVWRSLNRTGIKGNYTQVYINNDLVGLYVLNENYTPEFLDLNQQESVLYSGEDNTDNTKFNEFITSTPKSINWGKWEQKFPNPSQIIKWETFRQFNELAIDGTNTEFLNEIENNLVLADAIDYYLFVNLCNGYDNVGKNWFFLRKNNNQPFTILPWDLDATWGRDALGNATSSSEIVSNGLFNRLISLNPNNFVSDLKARWTTLRANQFSEQTIIAHFESNFNEIEKHQMATIENNLWSLNVNTTTEKNYIQNWVNARLTYLDNYFANL